MTWGGLSARGSLRTAGSGARLDAAEARARARRRASPPLLLRKPWNLPITTSHAPSRSSCTNGEYQPNPRARSPVRH